MCCLPYFVYLCVWFYVCILPRKVWQWHPKGIPKFEYLLNCNEILHFPAVWYPPQNCYQICYQIWQINCHFESQPQLFWRWSHPADNTEIQPTQKVSNKGEVWNSVFHIAAISCNIGIKDQKQNSVSGQITLEYQ